MGYGADREIIIEGRLTRVEAKLDAVNDKLDEAILSQLKDHGKRINALERRGWWMAGWITGAGAVGALAAKLLERVG